MCESSYKNLTFSDVLLFVWLRYLNKYLYKKLLFFLSPYCFIPEYSNIQSNSLSNPSKFSFSSLKYLTSNVCMKKNLIFSFIKVSSTSSVFSINVLIAFFSSSDNLKNGLSLILYLFL